MHSSFPRISDIKDYILTAFLLIIASALLVGRSDSGLDNFRKASITVFSYLQEPFAKIRSYRQALKSNGQLRKQNIQLLDKLNKLRSVQQNNIELRRLLNFKSKSNLRLYPVQIVGKELNQINSFITVDAGSKNGIKQGMPMISAQGLVGQVVLVSHHHAQIMPFFNSLFKVSAKLENSNAYGIVQWSVKKGNRLTLSYVPQTVHVQTGEVVITSGYSNKYPANIPIGKVATFKPNKGKDTQQIFITPFVHLHSVSAGFIVTNKQDSSLKTLNQNYQQLFK